MRASIWRRASTVFEGVVTVTFLENTQRLQAVHPNIASAEAEEVGITELAGELLDGMVEGDAELPPAPP